MSEGTNTSDPLGLTRINPFLGLVLVVVRALVSFMMCAPFFLLDHLDVATENDMWLEILFDVGAVITLLLTAFLVLQQTPVRSCVLEKKDEDLSKTEREIKDVVVNWNFPEIQKSDHWLFFLPVLLSLLPIPLGFIGGVPVALRCVLQEDEKRLVISIGLWILTVLASLDTARSACLLVLVKRSEVEKMVDSRNLSDKKKIQ